MLCSAIGATGCTELLGCRIQQCELSFFLEFLQFSVAFCQVTGMPGQQMLMEPITGQFPAQTVAPMGTMQPTPGPGLVYPMPEAVPANQPPPGYMYAAPPGTTMEAAPTTEAPMTGPGFMYAVPAAADPATGPEPGYTFAAPAIEGAPGASEGAPVFAAPAQAQVGEPLPGQTIMGQTYQVVPSALPSKAAAVCESP